jgi:hypothetical protein
MRAAAVSAIALAVIVGACGGGGAGATDAAGQPTSPAAAATDRPTTDGAAIDVCAMISPADVQAALGVPAEAGIDGSTGDLRLCSWTGASDPTEVLAISVYVHPDAATAREQYLATTEGLDGVEILNLGDEASYSESFGLRVLAGRYDLSVDGTGPEEKASDLTIAQQVLAALP